MTLQNLSEAAQSALRDSNSRPRDALEAIEKARPGPNTMSTAPLPGHGDVYGVDNDEGKPACGIDTRTFFCSEHGHSHEKAATCERWECPRCWKARALSAGSDSSAKLIHFRDKYCKSKKDVSKGTDVKKFHRVIISPPSDWSTSASDARDRALNVCKDVLDAGGADGGVIIPHLYRHADEPDLDFDDWDDRPDDALLALTANEDSRGVWPETLPDWANGRTPSWSDTEKLLVHEPHFHCYVVADHIWLPTEQIYEETGWFIRRLEPYEKGSASCYSASDLARSITYAMSHLSNFEGTPNYRYFGAVANEAASEAQKRRASRLCRRHAPKLLGLPQFSVSCSDRLEDDEESFESFEGSGGCDDGCEDDDAFDEPVCNAPIVPLQQLPYYLDRYEYSEARVRTLIEAYIAQEGELPPGVDEPPPDLGGGGGEVSLEDFFS